MKFLSLLCFFVAILFLDVTVSVGGELKTGGVPSWVQWQERPLVSTAPANPTGLEFLFYDVQERVAGGEFFRHFAYQVVSQEGLSDGAELSFTFDPDYQSVILHRLKIWRNGTARDYCDIAKFQIIQQERELDRRIYNGRRTALCFLDDVRVGDIVEVSLTISGRNPVYGGHYTKAFPVSWGSPVREQSIRVIPRDGQRLRWRWQGAPNPAVRAEPREGGELRWLAGPVPASLSESGEPSWFTPNGYLQLSDFDSWAEVAAWALPLYDQPADGQHLQQQAARLAQWPGGLEDKAVAAVDFVQKEIRYLGMEMGASSHRPSPPETTLERRFGDCKDKALLLTALLRKLGVEAHPVLVSTVWGEHLDEQQPAPAAFDHAVTLIVSGGKHYVIDATDSYQAGKRLADRHMGIYGRGLVVRKGEAQLAKFDLGEHDRGGVDISERFTVSDYRAPAEFHVTTTYRGADADRQRDFIAGTPREDLEKQYRDYYTRYYPAIKTIAPVELRDDTTGNVVQVSEHYRIDNFFAPVGDTGKVRAKVSAPYILENLPQTSAQDRRAPLALRHPRTLAVTTRVEFPDDWDLSDRVNVSTPWFNYRGAERTERGRTVVREHRLTVSADHVPAADLERYLAKREQVSDNFTLEFTHQLAAETADDDAEPDDNDNGFYFWVGLIVLLGMFAVFVVFVIALVWLVRHLTRAPKPPPLPLE